MILHVLCGAARRLRWNHVGLASLLALLGCSVTVGPHMTSLAQPTQRPLLRLVRVDETLTGSWAGMPNAGFRDKLSETLQRTQPAALFTDDPSALAVRIDLVSDHAADETRLMGLGLLSMVTVGVLPLKYHSEWSVKANVTVAADDGSIVAHYPLEETGTYDIWAFPPTMFSLFFGGALQGEADYRRMVAQTTHNLASGLIEAVSSDYPRLAQLRTPSGLAQREPARRASEAQADAAPEHADPAYSTHYARRIAAVVGIDAYAHWPALEGAARDARSVAEQLRAMGFDEVVEIYDRDATRSRILRLLGNELAERTGRDDLAVIFFAGHGQTETLANGQKRGYIIPADAEQVDIFSTAISMDTLRDLSNRIPAKHVYFAMDSCYSGLGFLRGISRVQKSEGYLEKMTSLRAVQMITAGAEGEAAVELGGHGLFTTKFLAALRGEADVDGDGAVTASEIGTYVRPSVTRDSRQRQTPQFGSLEGLGEVVFQSR